MCVCVCVCVKFLTYLCYLDKCSVDLVPLEPTHNALNLTPTVNKSNRWTVEFVEWEVAFVGAAREKLETAPNRKL